MLIIAFLFSQMSLASPIYFQGSQAFGTESMANVKATEFLFSQNTDSLKLCGFWAFADGTKTKFEYQWQMNGSDIRKGEKSIGSYNDGNFLIEEALSNQEILSLEVTRQGPRYFEYHFHLPKMGFVDADGWIQDHGSPALIELCGR